MSKSPEAALAAVHARLADVRPQIGVLRSRRGDRKDLGVAAQVALIATGQGTETGGDAAIHALTKARKLIAKFTDDKAHPNARDVARACNAALPALTAIDWHPEPALGKVTIASGPGDVQASATVPVKITVALRRGGDLAAPAKCGWAFAGLGPAPLVDVAMFPPGSADSEAAVTIPPRPGMVDPIPFTFQVQAPFVGLDPTPPAAVKGRLLPPAADPLRSVVSVARGFDAVVLSATAPTAGEAVLSRTGAVAAALSVPVTVSGLQEGDLAEPVEPAQFAAAAVRAPVTLRFGPGAAGAKNRAARLDIDVSGGGFDRGTPAGFAFTVRQPGKTTSPGAPKPLDPKGYANQEQADPASWSRVTKGLRPNTALGLEAGRYSFTSVHVPGVLVYALATGKVIVDNRVQLHEADTAILGLVCNGGVVLDADRARASRCVLQQSGGVDCVSFQGRDQILDFSEVTGFQSVGIGAAASRARDPLVYGVHLHGQAAGGQGGTLAMAMIGHSHNDSDQPVNIHFVRVLVEGARSHDGLEVKSSGAEMDDCTVIGCDLMQRHGIVALTARSCWVEQGDIQLNSNNPTAIRCKTPSGIVRVVAGTASVEEVLHKHGGPSLYPYAVGAQVHDHEGKVVVGWARPGWHKPPLKTTTSRCSNLEVVGGATCGKATPIPADKLPPPARRLAAADVGPRVA